MIIAQGTVSISGTGSADGSGGFTVDTVDGDDLSLLKGAQDIVVNGNTYSVMKLSDITVDGVWELADNYSWSATVNKIVPIKGGEVNLPYKSPELATESQLGIIVYIAGAKSKFSVDEEHKISAVSWENPGRRFFSITGPTLNHEIGPTPVGIDFPNPGFIVTAVAKNSVTFSCPSRPVPWTYDDYCLYVEGGYYPPGSTPPGPSGTAQLTYIASYPDGMSSVEIFNSNADGGAGPTLEIKLLNYVNSENIIRGLNRGIF